MPRMILTEKMKKPSWRLLDTGTSDSLNYLSGALQLDPKGLWMLSCIFWVTCNDSEPLVGKNQVLANQHWQEEAGKASAPPRSCLHVVFPRPHPPPLCVYTQQQRLISSHFLSSLWRYFSSTALNWSYLEQFSLSASFHSLYH